MPLEGKMSLWQSKELEGEPVPRSTTPPVWDGESLNEYGLDGEDDFPELREYREVLVNSPAYSWLASTLAAEFRLETLGEDVRGGIRQKIVNILEQNGKNNISREVAPLVVEMVFNIPWVLTEFLAYQDYPIPATEALPQVIVLVGADNNIQASTVSDYISDTWPFYGPVILALFQDLLAGEMNCKKLRKWLPFSIVSIPPGKITVG